MGKKKKWLQLLLILGLLTGLYAGCGQTDEGTDAADAGEAEDASDTDLEPGVYMNGVAVELEEEGEVDLDLLSVEEGVTVTVVPEDGEEISINGDVVSGDVSLDIDAITREDVLTIEITGWTDDDADSGDDADDDNDADNDDAGSDADSNTSRDTDGDGTLVYTVNLMPSTFGDFTTEGESATEGDYYMSTYDADVNYIFKLDSQGNLIFYKKTGENALDFRKQYNSDGEVRYTYLLYLENSFCGISGINPGCVVVMDESYEVIDELYYQTADGDEAKVDPHGFIYLDDGHYILTSYEDVLVEDVPEDLNAEDDSAYLAVLYVQEVQDGEVLWEFCSADYPQFLYATTEVDWEESASECYDYMHFNSMYIDTDENLLISCRNANSILKISREDGSLIWILGGTEDEFGLTEDQLFSKQHSIIVTEDGSYMLFNNADDEVASGDAEVSSIIRLKVDEETMEVTEYLKYDTEFYSNYMGSIRELDAANGIYLYAVGGNWTGKIPEWYMIEYSETEGNYFTFRFDDGNGLLYCANKCE